MPQLSISIAENMQFYLLFLRLTRLQILSITEYLTFLFYFFLFFFGCTCLALIKKTLSAGVRFLLVLKLLLRQQFFSM
jgi:hypothetical protein